MVLGKLPVSGRPTIWITVGQGPTALTVGAGGGCLDIFTLLYPFSPLSPSLWETARYRLKYCLKGPLNPKQPTNQPTVGICHKDGCPVGIRKYPKVLCSVYSNVLIHGVKRFPVNSIVTAGAGRVIDPLPLSFCCFIITFFHK